MLFHFIIHVPVPFDDLLLILMSQSPNPIRYCFALLVGFLSHVFLLVPNWFLCYWYWSGFSSYWQPISHRDLFMIIEAHTGTWTSENLGFYGCLASHKGYRTIWHNSCPLEELPLIVLTPWSDSPLHHTHHQDNPRSLFPSCTFPLHSLRSRPLHRMIQCHRHAGVYEDGWSEGLRAWRGVDVFLTSCWAWTEFWQATWFFCRWSVGRCSFIMVLIWPFRRSGVFLCWGWTGGRRLSGRGAGSDRWCFGGTSSWEW